ncbi:MAG: glycosyltransferase family 1 protein, partial [Hamadaea sp.]|nr:glycosyltransferase family 1 protein [Hamadaea sp.]
MRALLCFIGGSGHLLPLIPIARAAVAAGHEVAFSGPPGTLRRAGAAGFTVLHPDEPGEAPAEQAPQASEPPKRGPLEPLDIAREEAVMRDNFAGRAAPKRVETVLSVARKWQPDVIVSDEVDFGSQIAAEVLGLPRATVITLGAGGFIRPDVVGEPLARLRAEHGLPAEAPEHLVITPFPASFRDPGHPLPASAHAINQTPFVKRTAPPGEDPLVYVTLGTVFNRESGDLFERILAGLHQAPGIRVLVTVGEHIDPAEFGPQPPHVRIERFVDQALILPDASLVISHGGSGSVVGALAHGLPAILLPMGADQPHNAARCAALGVARVLDAAQADPAQFRDTVMEMLRDPAYAEAARRMQHELAAQP